MGAFHEGHLDLMRLARREVDQVVVSLFVNPTQFAPTEDLSRYPRDESRDAELAESVGVDVLYCPTVEHMFPRGTTTVQVREVTDHFEGALRPSHFEGVATVVLKLINQVRPELAVFGRKDLQQCAVIQRMVEDLDVPVTLKFAPTTREEDGLALSSRNVYLSAEERRIAPELNRSLRRIRGHVHSQSYGPHLLAQEREGLSALGFRVEYLDLIDIETMKASEDFSKSLAVAVAARIGKTRLIDNELV